MKNSPGPNMFPKDTTEIIAINHADFLNQFGSRSLKGKKSNLVEEKKNIKCITVINCILYVSIVHIWVGKITM